MQAARDEASPGPPEATQTRRKDGSLISNDRAETAGFESSLALPVDVLHGILVRIGIVEDIFRFVQCRSRATTSFQL